VHILDRSPTLAVRNKTPEEVWSGFKPSVSHFRIFGCIFHVHVPDNKRVKLDDKSIKCILLGVSEEFKAYRLFDPISQRIIVSRDVIFQEDQKWNWDDSHTETILADLEWKDDNEEHSNASLTSLEEESYTNNTSDASTITPAINPATINPALNPVSELESVPTNTTNRGAFSSDGRERIRRPPTWMEDYVSDQGLSDEENVNMAHLALFSDHDPLTYEEAVQNRKWRQAMDAEINAIMKNDTWELTKLPSGVKTIGVKWIFKTKLNEHGEVDKYKARLVAKGYSQQYGVDYAEVFALVARLDTIRVVISLTALNSWMIYQLDVKSAFLHGELDEEVFVDQPPGYEHKGHESKVYRLKKALYGLKQAPLPVHGIVE